MSRASPGPPPGDEHEFDPPEPAVDSDALDADSAGLDADAAADCEKRAVALLARREHGRVELERKLAARGFRPGAIAAALDRLEQNGLLSGQRFMAAFIASRAARGSGPEKIRAELLQRGVRPDEAESALREADEDWAAAARRARTKRFGSSPPGTFEERARQARFLRGRGFTGPQIEAALEVDADSD